MRSEILPRRVFVKGGACALLATTAAPRLLVRAARAAEARRRVLVAVFQRGAVDGLAMVPPYGDPAYASARPAIAIQPPRPSDSERAHDLDGFFALHPALARRRARARGPVGRPVEMGVRDPGARWRIRTGRERGRGEVGREGLGHDPERLGCEVDLQAQMVAERVPVDLDRERRLRRDQHVTRIMHVVDVPPVDVARRAEHLPGDPRNLPTAVLQALTMTAFPMASLP